MVDEVDGSGETVHNAWPNSLLSRQYLVRKEFKERSPNTVTIFF